MLLSDFQNTIGEQFSGIYLFVGEETYYRRSIEKRIRQVVLTAPDFNTFNHIVHEGKDVDYSTLLQDIQTPPFYADKKLIEWHSIDYSNMKESDYSGLASLQKAVLNNPSSIVLLICPPDLFDAGSNKRPSTIFKKVEEIIPIINFEKCTDAQLLEWMGKHVKAEGLSVSNQTLRVLLSRVGHSMDLLNNELIKLTCYALANNKNKISEEDVLYVTTSQTEEDFFGLTNSIAYGKKEEAFSNLQDMKYRKVDPAIILSQLYRFSSDALETKLLLADGLDQNGITKALGTHEVTASIYIKYATKKSLNKLRESLMACQKMDLQVKTNYGTNTYDRIDILLSQILSE